MTTQEAYEAIRAYFTRPGAKIAIDPEEGCVYRGDGNPNSDCRCAFGCLIPDDLYRPSFEGVNVIRVLEIEPKLAKHLGEVATTSQGNSFLIDAQARHDNSMYDYNGNRVSNEEALANFITRLDALAKTHGLRVVA